MDNNFLPIIILLSMGISVQGCDTLNSPENGDVCIIGTQASYSCHSGFTLFGDKARFCTDGQSWTGEEPVCYKDCPEILNNQHTVLTVNGNRYLSVATATCLVDHCRVSGDFSRTCQADGTWAGSELICSKDCTNTGNVEPGGVDQHNANVQIMVLLVLLVPLVQMLLWV